MLSPKDIETLVAEFGRVPAWMITRDSMTLDEARDLLKLRAKACKEADDFFAFRRAARGQAPRKRNRNTLCGLEE